MADPDSLYWTSLGIQRTSGPSTSDQTEKPISEPSINSRLESIRPQRSTPDFTGQPALDETYHPTLVTFGVFTAGPTGQPTLETPEPTESSPSEQPALAPTNQPTSEPTRLLTSKPTKLPTSKRTKQPTMGPTEYPTLLLTPEKIKYATSAPSERPTLGSTDIPTSLPLRIKKTLRADKPRV